MIAKRFAFPCSLRRANGIAENASQPKMIANQIMYSGCPENFSVSEIGIANKPAINTNETIIYVNGTGYQPIDFAENIDEPNVSAALNESYICLENDSECYVPI